MTDIRDRGHELRFGIVTPQMWRSAEEMIDLWRRVEAAGWDSAFLVDHFISDWNGELGESLEAFTTLGAMARETQRIDLGVFVAGITHRPPMVLAKAAATVDSLSGGRFIFGIGAAWNEREHDAYGIPFPAAAERVALVDETLQALRRLEDGETTDYHGEHLRLIGAPFEPKPVRGRLPVLVGSRRPRMLDVLARLGDLWDAPAKHADIEATGALLDAACARHGRDPNLIVWAHEEVGRGEHATGEGLRQRVGTLTRLGVSYFLVNAWPGEDASIIERLGSELPTLRAALR
jgi:alkanesulfonate monooxygenase SsuD/methylene tetrahydromethanopterin reductase-like flavin-dependent oxidoreductase (luciferase family)